MTNFTKQSLTNLALARIDDPQDVIYSNAIAGEKSSAFSTQTKIILYIWFLLTVAFSILNMVCLVYPFWLGTTNMAVRVDAANGTIPVISSHYNSTDPTIGQPELDNLAQSNSIRHGYFGLYKHCVRVSSSILNKNAVNKKRVAKSADQSAQLAQSEFNQEKMSVDEMNITLTETQMFVSSSLTFSKCSGSWLNISSILNVYFKISTYLIVLACSIGIICVAVCFLIAFALPKIVLHMSSALQITIALLILTACLVFPLGWSDPRVQEVCGPRTTKFKLGANCELKWTYFLAGVQFVSSVLLSLLAHTLATNTDINPKYRQSNLDSFNQISTAPNIDELEMNKRAQIPKASVFQILDDSLQVKEGV